MRTSPMESPSISDYEGKIVSETRSIGDILDFNEKLQLTVFKEGLLYLVSFFFKCLYPFKAPWP